jgi:hypothetical protein
MFRVLLPAPPLFDVAPREDSCCPPAVVAVSGLIEECRAGRLFRRGTFRVAGPTALAVSRAIGDMLMKEPRRLVVADPETKCFDLSPQVDPHGLCKEAVASKEQDAVRAPRKIAAHAHV